MSTEYSLVKREGVELCATEHSSVLDIDVYIYNSGYCIARDLTPEQLADIGLHMIQIAAYQAGSKLADTYAQKVKELPC